MTNFGRYRLVYQPGPHDPFSGVLDHTVEMTISGEADLTQLTDLFDSFLRAAGYVYEGKLEIVNPGEKADFRYENPLSAMASHFFGAAEEVSLFESVDDVISYQ